MITISQLQAATLAARARTGDATIGTQIKAGRLQVVRVTYPAGKRGRSVVTPASDWLTAAECIARLEAMQ